MINKLAEKFMFLLLYWMGQKFHLGVFCYIILKNPNKLFGQSNKYILILINNHFLTALRLSFKKRSMPHVQPYWYTFSYRNLVAANFWNVVLDKHERKVKVKSLSRVRLFATPRTVAHQAPLSMGFSRQQYWSGLPLSSPGDLPDPGIEPGSPAL